MRIISPAGTELTNSEVVHFVMDGGREGIASVKRKVNYQNKNMDLCIYYEVETALEVGDLHCRNICGGTSNWKNFLCLEINEIRQYFKTASILSVENHYK